MKHQSYQLHDYVRFGARMIRPISFLRPSLGVTPDSFKDADGSKLYAQTFNYR